MTLPDGYRALSFPSVDSTNAEALRRAAAGEASGLWIRAATQTAGRGRQGRTWQSLPGNLFASLMLRPASGLATAPQLAFVAGIAVHEAVLGIAGGGLTGRLRLKWPNDLLLDGAKLAGILLESAGGHDGPAVVIGTGLNLAHAPQDAARPAASLAGAGIVTDVDRTFAALAHATAAWLAIWDEGRGWEAVRGSWIERGPEPGQLVEVREGAGACRGRYAGLAADGALLLDTGEGVRKSFQAGDVFLL